MVAWMVLQRQKKARNKMRTDKICKDAIKQAVFAVREAESEEEE